MLVTWMVCYRQVAKDKTVFTLLFLCSRVVCVVYSFSLVYAEMTKLFAV